MKVGRWPRLSFQQQMNVRPVAPDCIAFDVYDERGLGAFQNLTVDQARELRKRLARCIKALEESS